MWWPSLICFSFALCLSVLGIFRYINISKQPLYYSVPLVIAIYLPISIIYLLPSDYISANLDSNPPQWFQLPSNIILILWKSNYWITFILTWLILPIIQEYYKSGNYKPSLKIVDSLRANLKFQLIMFSVSIFGLIYLLINVGLTFNKIKLLIIALSHIYSLIISLWLMSHGLINIPRRKWLNGNLRNRLQTLYLRLPKINDDFEDIKINFKEDVLKVLSLEMYLQELNYRDWIYSLINKIPNELYHSMKSSNQEIPIIQSNQLSDSFLVKITTDFNKNYYKLTAMESEFNKIINEISDIEDTLNAKNSQKLVFRSSSSHLSPSLNFIIYYYVEPAFNKLSAIALGILSLIIIESEFFHSTRLSLVNIIIFKKLREYESLKLFVSIIFLSYMCISSLTSLTRTKVFNMYHLVSSNSDPVSACFYATYSSRLTLPLSYNFLTLFIKRTSQFESFYGNSIHLTGLINYLNNWLPRLILIPICLTTFNVYDKLKRRIGFDFEWDNFDDEENGASEGLAPEIRRNDILISEAKRIITMELHKREARNGLRPFNLNGNTRNNINDESPITNYADVQYDQNIQNFNQQLSNNRIEEYHDYEDDSFTPQTGNQQGSNIMNTFTGMFENFKNPFNRTIQNSNDDDTPLVL